MMESVLLGLIGMPVAIEVAGRSRKAARAVYDQMGMAQSEREPLWLFNDFRIWSRL